MALLLNCDLGESFGAWQMGLDHDVFPHINQANIACGFHAGDPLVMLNTLQLAKQHGVMIGAHPAYPDLVGFGRRSMNCSSQEIRALMLYQIGALDGMAQSTGQSVQYVKPHGALYNDMMAKVEVRQAIMQAIKDYHGTLTLMLQATPQWQQHKQEAYAHGIELCFEAFADRGYDDAGRLLPRSHPSALHTRADMLAQVQQLNAHGSITTVSGKTLELHADSLCVHGDNLAGVQAIAEVKALLTAP
ncbi:MAG: 5-oxoprolinase subunit PxpA [Bermanella sp.]